MTTKTVTFGCLTLFACGALAACSSDPGRTPTDVGNMAYPRPMPAGVISTTTASPGPRDTGNMAYPAPVAAGNVPTNPTARGPRDTGNMAYPQPLPAGNLSTTKVQ